MYFDAHTLGNGSYTFSGDMNGDGVSNNDLIYVPKDTSEMNFVPLTVGTTTYTRVQQQAAWNAFIQQDKYLGTRRGQYAQRNAVFLPMVYRVDASLSQDIGASIGGQRNRLQVRLDVLNLTNLINKNWGIGQTFTTTRPLTYVGVDANGAATYRLAAVGTNLISSSYHQDCVDRPTSGACSSVCATCSTDSQQRPHEGAALRKGGGSFTPPAPRAAAAATPSRRGGR